jgi:hypothetical protein
MLFWVLLCSMQVDEKHPSNMGIGGTKEGFSLFGLLQGSLSTSMVGQG